MHELSLAYSVVELVERELSCHGGGTLRKIEMAVGNLSGVDFDAFSFALDAVLAHSPFADVDLKIKRVEPRAECCRCGETYSPATRYEPCPQCGAFAPRLLAGEEFRLIALTVES